MKKEDSNVRKMFKLEEKSYKEGIMIQDDLSEFGSMDSLITYISKVVNEDKSQDNPRAIYTYRRAGDKIEWTYLANRCTHQITTWSVII